jgi:hypothetical protein
VVKKTALAPTNVVIFCLDTNSFHALLTGFRKKATQDAAMRLNELPFLAVSSTDGPRLPKTLRDGKITEFIQFQ